MSTVEQSVPPLIAGQRLTQAEFLRRWEAMPQLKFAELIGGIVYMPSPLSLEHGDMDHWVAGWLCVYAAWTQGCRGSNNATILMQDDAPQPDLHLRILPEYGGKSRVQGRYGAGAPELMVEVSLSRSAFDLHEKLELYQAAGVNEYVVVLPDDQEVRWHHLVNGVFERLAPDSAGILRSQVFPGLWLDPQALLAGDMAQVLAVLNEGLATPEHAAFVAQLAARRT